MVVHLVYVDDIILIGNNEVEISKVNSLLKSKFSIKDLGKMKYFIGIEVVDIHGVSLSFTNKILYEIFAWIWYVGV